jgi:ABC-2 type transport system permease protein
VLNLLRKELVRRRRSPVATLVMLAFPFLMAGMIGAVFGGAATSGDMFPVIDVLIWDQDDGFLSNLVLGPLQSDEAAKYLRVREVGEEGMTLIGEGKASALVIFPENFTDDVINGRPTQIHLLRNPSESIKPEIVEQGTQVLATYFDQAAKVFGPELKEIAAMSDLDTFPPAARLLALSQALIQRLESSRRFLFPPLVQLKTVKEAKESGGPDFNLYGYVLVMVSVMSVLFVTSRSILDLYDEEKTGMLRRQLATPLTVSRLIGAKIAFGVFFGVLVMLVLLAIGAILRWYVWPVNVAGILALTVVLSLASCGLLSIVYALCRTERQAGALNWLVIMGMSALGGSMTPIDSLPASLQRVGRFTLNFWAVDGYSSLLFLKEPLSAVARNLGILLVVGVLTVVVGRQLLVQKYRRALP